MLRSLSLSFAIFSLCILPQTFAGSGYEEIPDTNSLKILTPSLISRSTCKLRLTNGLEAYLVSDPNAEESAAALAVAVGSWSDPKEYPGMAHFLEHMLFMGTKAYPNENDFSQYITDHGGSSNAYTSLDRTVYMFSVNNSGFEGSLDRFSHFFIDPLFKTSAVGRELHAVDQEHAKNIQSDGRREWMIFKETGNPLHPNSAFATGNAETLGHIPREALVNWYNNHYLAPLMHLAVYSPLPMETLKELVVKDFSNAHQGPLAADIAYSPLSSSQQHGHIIYIKPIKDLKVLSLDWELPSNFAHDHDTKSAELIAYVLQSGGEHSLIEVLKKEHLAESLQADASRFSKDHIFLNINISLTTQGVEKVAAVIEKCFQTINLLKDKGIPLYLFNEMKVMSTLSYEYQSREQAFEFVSNAASNLLDEPLSTYPEKTYIATSYNPKTVQSILTFLTPQNCIYTLMASPELTKMLPDKKERWNGGEYTLKNLPQSALAQWSATKPSSLIALPAPNPYIPKNLTLVHQAPPSTAPPIPILLPETTLGKNYFWEDSRYEVPESDIYLGIKTPLIDGGAKSTAHVDLLIKTFYQKLSPLLSTANAAGLYGSIELKNLRLLLKVQGYSEKAPELLKNLLLGLKKLTCTQAEFNLYKESLLTFYSNQEKGQPYLQAGEIMSNILYNDAPLPLQKAEALKRLSYEDFLAFTKVYLSKSYIEGLYTGNLLKEDAEKLSTDVYSLLASEIYPVNTKNEKQVLLLPAQQGPYMVLDKINILGNAALLAIQEGSFSFKRKAAQTILGQILSESFFNTLRSKQQTGYITASWPREVQEQLFQFFLVQSTTHQPEDLIARFELFLENYVKDFSQEFPEERFEEVKENCIATLAQLPPNLFEMTSYLYDLAFTKKGNFSFTEQLTAAIKNISYEELKQESTLFFSRKNTQRLAVLIEGDASSSPFIYHKITADTLKQEGSFVSSSL
ncbi:MAG: insulinase family protein [Chlamydiota bacterium]